MTAATTSYIDEQRTRGARKGTLRTYESALKLFAGGDLQREVRRCDEAWLRKRVAARRAEGRAVDTVASELRIVKSWLRWCRGRGWAAKLELDEVRVEGRRKRGKPQLTADEAIRLRDVALLEPPQVAVAVLAPLLMGLDGAEVTRRRVRDIDCDGTVWCVPAGQGKTANREARVRIPEELQPAVAALVEGRQGSEWLFAGRGRGPRGQTWCQQHTRRLCAAAGVTEVCPHGLRGTLASLERELGTDLSVVARLMRHGGEEVTRRHYVSADAEQAARQRAGLRVMAGGKR